jgi:hypothetical protein
MGPEPACVLLRGDSGLGACSPFRLLTASLESYVVKNVLGQVDRKSRNER